MPVIKKPDTDKIDLNKVSTVRIQQISEAAKTEEETNIRVNTVNTPEKANTDDVEKIPARQKEEQINFKLPADVKIKWKKFFMNSNINITQGIIFAVENLIKEVEEGDTTLTRGGVFKKK